MRLDNAHRHTWRQARVAFLDGSFATVADGYLIPSFFKTATSHCQTPYERITLNCNFFFDTCRVDTKQAIARDVGSPGDQLWRYCYRSLGRSCAKAMRKLSEALQGQILQLLSRSPRPEELLLPNWRSPRSSLERL